NGRPQPDRTRETGAPNPDRTREMGAPNPDRTRETTASAHTGHPGGLPVTFPCGDRTAPAVVSQQRRAALLRLAGRGGGCVGRQPCPWGWEVWVRVRSSVAGRPATTPHVRRRARGFAEPRVPGYACARLRPRGGGCAVGAAWWGCGVGCAVGRGLGLLGGGAGGA